MRSRLLGLLVIAACLPLSRALAQGASTNASKRVRPRLFVVRKPTLITSFVTTQAAVDSSDEISEALSDYQHYLSLAIPVLEKHGIQVHVTNDSTLRWRDSLGVHKLSTTDGGGLVYLFVSPNGRTRVLREGVELDGAILNAAHLLFDVPLPTPAEEPDDP